MKLTVNFLSEKDIADFLAFYRKEFPRATILLKMHIMEDHVIPWLRRWHVDAGLMGEQGAESLHSAIHSMEERYDSISNRLDRLKYIVNEHNILTAPALNTLRPMPKSRGRQSI